jgi:hypothetical protein
MRQDPTRATPAPGRREILATAAAAVLGGAAAPPPAGMVDALTGEGYAVAVAARRTLALASSVFVGDVVGTRPASRMGLKLGTATEVRLGPEASIKIDRFVLNVAGVLELNSGAMFLDHDPSAGGPDLGVRSPFGLIAVRGTRFFAGPSNGVFGVFAQRGAVIVVGVNTAVALTAGMGTGIARPGDEPTPPVVWSDARVAAALALVGAG